MKSCQLKQPSRSRAHPQGQGNNLNRKDAKSAMGFGFKKYFLFAFFASSRFNSLRSFFHPFPEALKPHGFLRSEG